jgi:hypothetical protein
LPKAVERSVVTLNLVTARMTGLGQNPCFRPCLERQGFSSISLPRLSAMAQPQRLEIVYDYLLDIPVDSRRQNVLTRSREQRKNLRRFTRRAATLTLGDQKSSVDCVIWDISEDGRAWPSVFQRPIYRNISH